MPHFKDLQNTLYFLDPLDAAAQHLSHYEDGPEDAEGNSTQIPVYLTGAQHWLPADCVPITDEEAEAIRNPPKSADQLAAEARNAAKRQRAEQVAAITVITAAGHTFDGDEVSQGRMARAIIALQATGTPSINWVLADNSVIDATAAELTEALALAGAAQAAIWVLA